MENTELDATSREAVSLLLVEADELAARRIQEMLSSSRVATFEVRRVAGVEQALSALQYGSFGAVLMDLALHDAYALDSLLRARFAARSVPIVVLAYQDDEALALRAVRAGAADFLIKGEVSATLLSRTLMHAIERHQMMRALEKARSRERFLARNDPLTRLRNRYAFREELGEALEAALREGRELTLLFLDLDGFKAVNDNLGHSAGDTLLVDAAERIGRYAGEDSLVGRLGGDEFVVVAPAGLETGELVPWAERLRVEIEKAYQVAGLETWVGVSTGIATAPRDAQHPEELIRCADAAMYEAKSLGRGRVCTYSEHLRDMASERFELINRLREAIQAGDLKLVFQPQIDTLEQRVSGFEALVRWQHPQRGLVPPSEFVPVAEETGMVVSLGQWVLLRAVEALRDWVPADQRLAINVSTHQLSQQDFPRLVEEALAAHGIRPSRLEVELTESALANHAVIRSLEELRAIGVRIAIDDFGTGYSSFTLLRDVPAHVVKIDRTFVQRTRPDTPDDVVLASMVQMLSALGLGVIAEGVETVEAMNLLYLRGCGQMQGYLFGKPERDSEARRVLTDPGALWRRALSELVT